MEAVSGQQLKGKCNNINVITDHRDKNILVKPSNKTDPSLTRSVTYKQYITKWLPSQQIHEHHIPLEQNSTVYFL